MKAICGGRLVMHDRIEEGKAILFEDKIIGIVPESEVPAAVPEQTNHRPEPVLSKSPQML